MNAFNSSVRPDKLDRFVDEKSPRNSDHQAHSKFAEKAAVKLIAGATIYGYTTDDDEQKIGCKPNQWETQTEAYQIRTFHNLDFK